MSGKGICHSCGKENRFPYYIDKCFHICCVKCIYKRFARNRPECPYNFCKISIDIKDVKPFDPSSWKVARSASEERAIKFFEKSDALSSAGNGTPLEDFDEMVISACREGDLAGLEFLLSRGVRAEVLRRPTEALEAACVSNSPEIVRILISLDIRPNLRQRVRLFDISMTFESPDLFFALLDLVRYIQLDEDHNLARAAKHKKISIIETLTDPLGFAVPGDVHNSEALVEAVNADDEKCTRILIDAGADPSARGGSILNNAISRGKRSAAVVLIEKIDSANILADQMLYACSLGMDDLVRAFLMRGLSPGYKDNQAIVDAALFGHAGCVRVLAQFGADVHARDEEPLRRAVRFGDEDTVRALLEHGADPNADNFYQNACDLGRVRIAHLLLSKGANSSCSAPSATNYFSIAV